MRPVLLGASRFSVLSVRLLHDFVGWFPATTFPSTPFLYATDFHNGKIDVLNGSFALATLAPGHFTDPNLPAGYTPFNIQNLGGKLFVTYAKQVATGMNPVPGVGNGFIDVFNLDGTPGLMNSNVRLVSNGPLNEPWGMAIASSTFGQFAGDLLVGNHGDGTIDAFDPSTGMLLGMLKDAQGNPIVNDNLWALGFRGQGSGFDADGLFFTAARPILISAPSGACSAKFSLPPRSPVPSWVLAFLDCFSLAAVCLRGGAGSGTLLLLRPDENT